MKPHTLERAIECALFAHKGQTDKGGQPYILHPLRVMMAMQTDHDRIVAALHDVVEAAETGVDDVQQEFGDTIADAIDALTKRVEESYQAYVLIERGVDGVEVAGG